MTTLRVWLSSPTARTARTVASVAVTLAVYTLLVAVVGTHMLGTALGMLALAGSAAAGFLLPPRPAPAPVRRRALPRHAKRRGMGAAASTGRRGGRAHKPAPGGARGYAPGAHQRPAAVSPSSPGTRSAAGLDLDRTQRLPIYRHGRAPVRGGVR